MNKAKETMRKIATNMEQAADRLSGKKVEESVTEYTELFTKIALGLHEDFESIKKQADQITNQQSDISKALQQLTSRLDKLETLMQEQKNDYAQSIMKLEHDILLSRDTNQPVLNPAADAKLLCVSALVVSCSALLGVIWILL